MMDKKQIFDIHLEFDSSGHLEKMVIVEEGGDEINVPSGQCVGFNTTNPHHKLVVEDCPVGIGDPPGSLPEVLHVVTEGRAGIQPCPGGGPASSQDVRPTTNERETMYLVVDKKGYTSLWEEKPKYFLPHPGSSLSDTWGRPGSSITNSIIFPPLRKIAADLGITPGKEGILAVDFILRPVDGTMDDGEVREEAGEGG